MSTIPMNRMGYFAMLTHAEQLNSIRSLMQSGISEYGIADITGMHVEQVRRMLGQHPQCEGCEE